MDIFRECAVEAQITMEDIKDEINMIVSSFKCRHQKVNYILIYIIIYILYILYYNFILLYINNKIFL